MAAAESVAAEQQEVPDILGFITPSSFDNSAHQPADVQLRLTRCFPVVYLGQTGMFGLGRTNLWTPNSYFVNSDEEG